MLGYFERTWESYSHMLDCHGVTRQKCQSENSTLWKKYDTKKQAFFIAAQVAWGITTPKHTYLA